MMLEETVGNPDLEVECLAAQILSGIILPDTYTDLRVTLAGLTIPMATDKLTVKLMTLKDEVVGKLGTLDDKVLKKYYYGENPELKSLIKSIAKEVEKQIDLFGEAVLEKMEETTSLVEEGASTMEYYDLGQAIDRAQLPNAELQQIDQTHTQLRKMEGVLRATLEAYGKGKEKLPKKPVVATGLTPKYKLFLQELSMYLDEVTGNMKLAFTLAKAIDSISQLIPKEELDPYLADVCKNYIDVVTAPESFYSMCSRNEIVSGAVGQMFAHAYPEYYNKYLDMYMEDVPTMDYQNQIDFRKCFGLDSDDSATTMLCAKYVKLGFQSPQ